MWHVKSSSPTPVLYDYMVVVHTSPAHVQYYTSYHIHISPLAMAACHVPVRMRRRRSAHCAVQCARPVELCQIRKFFEESDSRLPSKDS